MILSIKKPILWIFDDIIQKCYSKKKKKIMYALSVINAFYIKKIRVWIITSLWPCLLQFMQNKKKLDKVDGELISFIAMIPNYEEFIENF